MPLDGVRPQKVGRRMAGAQAPKTTTSPAFYDSEARRGGKDQT